MSEQEARKSEERLPGGDQPQRKEIIVVVDDDIDEENENAEIERILNEDDTTINDQGSFIDIDLEELRESALEGSSEKEGKKPEKEREKAETRSGRTTEKRKLTREPRKHERSREKERKKARGGPETTERSKERGVKLAVAVQQEKKRTGEEEMPPIPLVITSRISDVMGELVKQYQPRWTWSKQEKIHPAIAELTRNYHKNESDFWDKIRETRYELKKRGKNLTAEEESAVLFEIVSEIISLMDQAKSKKSGGSGNVERQTWKKVVEQNSREVEKNQPRKTQAQERERTGSSNRIEGKAHGERSVAGGETTSEKGRQCPQRGL